VPSQGLRVNAVAYIEALETIVKPWIDNVNGGRLYVFQQDSASHKAMRTQDWMSKNLHNHIIPNMWPPRISPGSQSFRLLCMGRC